MGVLCKKLISIVLIMTLLINSNASVFAQVLEEDILRGIDTQMIELKVLAQEEFAKLSEKEIMAREIEAMGILQERRAKKIEDYAKEGKESDLSTEVSRIIKLLAPFYGASIEEVTAGYSDSEYFKEPGSLNKYLYERAVIIGSEYGSIGMHNLRSLVEGDIRNVFIMGSANRREKAKEEAEHGNAIANAFVMLAYGESFGWNDQGDYKDAVKFAEDWCKSLEGAAKEEGKGFDYEGCIEEQLKDDPYYLLYKDLGKYDNSVMKERKKEIKVYGELAEIGVIECIDKVLRPLQAGKNDLAFRSIKEYLNIAGRSLPWGLCGVSAEEGKALILSGTMSYEEGDKAARNVQSPENFWNRTLLDSWKYITPSHYAKRSEAIEGIESRYPEESAGLSENEKNRAAIRSIYLENSLNKSLANIASNMMLYGLIYLYGTGNTFNTKLGEGLYTIAMGTNGDEWGRWAELPIAELARNTLHGNKGFLEYTSPNYPKGKALYDFEHKLKYKRGLYQTTEVFYVASDLLITWLGFSLLAETGVVRGAFQAIWGAVRNTKVGQGITAAGNAINKVGKGVTGWMGEALGIPGYGSNGILKYNALREISVISGDVNPAVKASMGGLRIGNPGKPMRFNGLTESGPVKVDIKTGKVTSELTGAEIKPGSGAWKPGQVELVGQRQKGLYDLATGKIRNVERFGGQSQTLTATVGEGSGGAANEVESAFSKIRGSEEIPGGVRIGGQGAGGYNITPEKAAVLDAEIDAMEAERAAALANPAKPVSRWSQFWNNVRFNVDLALMSFRHPQNYLMGVSPMISTSAEAYNAPIRVATEVVAEAGTGAKTVPTIYDVPLNLFDRMGLNTQMGSSGRAVSHFPNTFKVSTPKLKPNFRNGFTGLKNLFTIPANAPLLVRLQKEKELKPLQIAAAITGATIGLTALSLFSIPTDIGFTLAIVPLSSLVLEAEGWGLPHDEAMSIAYGLPADAAKKRLQDYIWFMEDADKAKKSKKKNNAKKPVKEEDLSNFIEGHYIKDVFRVPFNTKVKPMRILVANDEYRFDKEIQKFLKESPYSKYIEKVDFVDTGAEVIKRLKKDPNHYDIIFQDF